MPKIYSIEGNIGSGKSTLIKFMKKHRKWIKHRKIIYLQEPVKTWEAFTDNSENIIEKFYNDQKEWAFSFQMMAYISRISQLKKTVKKYPQESYIIITERCIETDKNVFAKMLHDDDKIHPINYQIYLKWFNEFVYDLPIQSYIYLKTEPEICLQRITKRDRKGETISLDYLKKCHSYHNDWLNKKNNKLVIDLTKKMSVELFNIWINDIIAYIGDNINIKNKDIIELSNNTILTSNHFC